MKKIQVEKISVLKSSLYSHFPVVVLFLVFFVFLIIQHFDIFLGHDDWGYATLSYVYFEPGVHGQEFSIGQLVHFLYQHYMLWGGRVLSFAQEILLLKAGTNVFRVVQSAVICLIAITTWHIAKRGAVDVPQYLVAILACSLFGFFSHGMYNSGFYWFSASIAFLFPILYLFAGAVLLNRILFDRSKTKTHRSIVQIVACSLLFFFAGFSVEHIGVASVACTVTMITVAAIRFRDIKGLCKALPVLAAALIGCYLLLAAPGNYVRQSTGLYDDYYQLDMLHRLIYAGNNIGNTIFSSSNTLFVILLFVTAGIIAYINLGQALNIICRFVNLLTFGLSVALSIYWFVPTVTIDVYLSNFDLLRALILWIYAVLVMISVSCWLLPKKNSADLLTWFLFIAGLVSVGAALASPIFPERCALLFHYSWYLVVARLFASIPWQTELKKINALPTIVVFSIVAVAAVNLSINYAGYHENAAVSRLNEELIQRAKLEINERLDIGEIIQMKIPNPYYAQLQPYNRDLIVVWMKRYYDLPDSIEFVFIEYDYETYKALASAD